MGWNKKKCDDKRCDCGREMIIIRKGDGKTEYRYYECMMCIKFGGYVPGYHPNRYKKVHDPKRNRQLSLID